MSEFKSSNSSINLCDLCGESDELTLQGFLHCQACVQKIHSDILEEPINRSVKRRFEAVKNGYGV